jgi:hypothetical protein
VPGRGSASALSPAPPANRAAPRAGIGVSRGREPHAPGGHPLHGRTVRVPGPLGAHAHTTKKRKATRRGGGAESTSCMHGGQRLAVRRWLRSTYGVDARTHVRALGPPHMQQSWLQACIPVRVSGRHTFYVTGRGIHLHDIVQVHLHLVLQSCRNACRAVS